MLGRGLSRRAPACLPVPSQEQQPHVDWQPVREGCRGEGPPCGMVRARAGGAQDPCAPSHQRLAFCFLVQATSQWTLHFAFCAAHSVSAPPLLLICMRPLVTCMAHAVHVLDNKACSPVGLACAFAACGVSDVQPW